VQVVVEQLLVELGDRLEEMEARRVGQVGQVARDLALDQLRALRALFVSDRLHLDQVDRAHERVAGEHRDVQRHRLGAEPVLHHLHDVVEVGADAVHLVDERDARDVVLVGLAPHRLALRLDAADRAEHRDRAVQHAQRPLHFHGEVHVAGRVDDVDAVVAPGGGGGGGGDGDAALALLLHPVHRGGAVVHLAHAVDAARIEQHPLGQGGLAGVDMGHDADVSIFFERSLPRHVQASFEYSGASVTPPAFP
jgi:hypothetical protein